QPTGVQELCQQQPERRSPRRSHTPAVHESVVISSPDSRGASRVGESGVKLAENAESVHLPSRPAPPGGENKDRRPRFGRDVHTGALPGERRGPRAAADGSRAEVVGGDWIGLEL